MFQICLVHLLAMVNAEMNLSSIVSYTQGLEILLFMAVAFTYGLFLSYMIFIFRLRIFNLFKYVGGMSLISTNSQQPSLVIINQPIFAKIFIY